MNTTAVKLLYGVAGVVVGGVVVFAVITLTGSDHTPSTSSGSRATSSLRFVVVVSRHGNRGGSWDYLLDPYPLNNSQYWPYGANALTPRGRIQAHNLGKKLRLLYNGFLPSTFRSDDIYACSDLYERVVMSGDLVLAGLYPPEGWQVWDKNVKWQPVALYTNSSDHSVDAKTCPRYVAQAQELYARFLTNNTATIASLSSYIRNVSGENVSVEDLYYMFEKMKSEETEGYSLPDWSSNLFPDPLTSFYSNLYSTIWAGSEEMVRLLVGNLLEEIVEAVKRNVKTLSSTSQKLHYISGHDTTIASLQVALGVGLEERVGLVSVGSALVLEIHRDNSTGNHTVQVVFVNGSSLDSDPLTLSLSACGDPCELDTFLKYTSKFTNVSFQQECLLNSTNPQGYLRINTNPSGSLPLPLTL